MTDQTKSRTFANDIPVDERMIVTINLGELQGVIATEIEAARKQEFPRLLYTTTEAAQILAVPTTWLATQARAGKIPFIRKGHYVRFRLADLEAFAARSDNDRTGVDT